MRYVVLARVGAGPQLGCLDGEGVVTLKASKFTMLMVAAPALLWW